MDKHEANAILRHHLDQFRGYSYDALHHRVNSDERQQVTGESGTIYQVHVTFVWDDKPDGSIRITGSIDDGGWRAYVPLTDELLMDSDGRFVDESDDDRLVCVVRGKPYFVPTSVNIPWLLTAVAVLLGFLHHWVHWLAIPVVILAAGYATPHFNLANGCVVWVFITAAGIASFWMPDVAIPLATWAFVAWITSCIEQRTIMKPCLPSDKTTKTPTDRSRQCDFSLRPKNYRRIALAAIDVAEDPVVLMNNRQIKDFSDRGPLTQRGIRVCRDFEIRDGQRPILGFHDHPDEMWFDTSHDDLLRYCKAQGWLKIQR